MSSAALAGHRRQESLTIGEVLAVLCEEFPDVTISKIRFLEEQGLVEPDRTPSGYRKFSADHVHRLRHVLTLQRDHFLPLRVIREQLEAGAPGSEEPAAGQPSLVRMVRGEEHQDSRVDGEAGLAAASGADAALVSELVGHGLVRTGSDGRFGPDDIEVARAAVALARHGVEPRHLRMFRTAADKEVDLVRQVVAPVRRSSRAGSAGEAADTAREVAATCLRLHAALVAGALGRL